MKRSQSVNPDEIPLKILICDPDPRSVDLLRSSFSHESAVAICVTAKDIAEAQASLRRDDINTVFIDVLGLGVNAGADLVFSIRKALPEIVFVLFIDRNQAESKRAEFYGGERSRFSHYYTLQAHTRRCLWGGSPSSTIQVWQRLELAPFRAEPPTITRGSRDP